MQLVDLFPFCLKDPCPIAGKDKGPHKHILPAQKELLESLEKYVASVGGYGSGKSVAAAALMYLLGANIPGNRILIGRRTYVKLHETAYRVFFEVLQRSGTQYQLRENYQGYYHHIVLSNESEVLFRETKDPGRFLGPEYGAFWIDEGQEEPRETMIKLMGRLRLPIAGAYLKGVFTTNPPPPRHWINTTFGDGPGVVIRKDPATEHISKYRRIWSVSSENPNLPEGYIEDLRAVLRPEEVARVLSGKTTFVTDGKPVYGNHFRLEKHMRSTLEPWLTPDNQPRPFIRGWDFGYHCPAVLWQQILKCYNGRPHWLVHREYIGQDIESEDLAVEILKQSKLYYDIPRDWWKDIGDHAGTQPTEGGPGPIIRLAQPPFRIKFVYKKFKDLDPGINLIRRVLGQRDCACGSPTFLIHPRCQVTIAALQGGYHYPKERYDREIPLKPIKDGLYDNPMDALRYTGELEYRMLMTRIGDIPGAMGDPKLQWPAWAHRDPWSPEGTRTGAQTGPGNRGPQGAVWWLTRPQPER